MRHFLYLTNTRLVSMTTQGKRIVARREFAVSGAGMSEFENHAQRMAEYPTHGIHTTVTAEYTAP